MKKIVQKEAPPRHDTSDFGAEVIAAAGDQLARSRVFDFKITAKFLGISLATLERLIASGNGPPIVVLSPRRKGCRAGDLVDWINARVARSAA
jgi:hypothetical protein